MTPRKTEGAPPAKVSAPPYAKRPNKQKTIPPPTAEQEQIGTPRKPVKNTRREEIFHPDEWFNNTLVRPLDQLVEGIANFLPWATPAQFAACDHALALLNRVADELEIIRLEEVG